MWAAVLPGAVTCFLLCSDPVFQCLQRLATTYVSEQNSINADCCSSGRCSILEFPNRSRNPLLIGSGALLSYLGRP
jgi:hypothetical protein